MVKKQPTLFEELKRRSVIRVGLAYAVVAWLVAQIADLGLESFQAPNWVMQTLLLLLALGLPLALFFAWAFELTPEGIKREEQVDRSKSPANRTGRRLDFGIIGLLSVALAYFVVTHDWGTESEGPKSIAVLPFENMSSDPEQEFFSDGITEEILNALAAVKQLKVVGRTSSFAFKGQNDDLRRIGDTLGVGHILEGSVRRSGTKVRISAQLVQVDDGFHVWADTFERELTDIFAIQDEIAAAIIGQLKAALLIDEQQAMASQRTTPEVYDRYLLARQRMYDRSRAALEDALRLLDEAIDTDAEYAPAYAQRGIVAMLLADDSYGTIPKDEALQQGKRYLDLALEIDAESAEALAGLGLYYIDRVGTTDKAIEALTQSLSINPNQPDARVWLANALSRSGDIAGQLKMLEELAERDPLFRPAFVNTVFAFNGHGMPVKALALIERVRSFDPNDPTLLLAEAGHLYFRGDIVEGFRLAKRARSLAPNDQMANLVFNGGLLQTQQLEQLVKTESVPFVVDALDALGRRDEAFEQALGFASRGLIRYLFVLYNRVDRSDELVAYLEKRWPSLDAFAADYAPDEFGYGVMLSIALAYSRTGNEERFAEALHLYEQGIAQVKDQGADNRFMDLESALHYAVAGNQEKALEILESLADKGTFAILPLGESVPEFGSIKSEPRFVAVENRMLELVNSQRAELGFGPVNPAKDFWQYNK